MPLPIRYLRRGSRAVLVDMNFYSDPVEDQTINSGATSWVDPLWTLTIPQDDLMKGGRIRTITVTMELSCTEDPGDGIKFYMNGAAESLVIPASQDAYSEFTYTYLITDFSQDAIVQVRTHDTNHTWWRKLVLVTVGREIL